MVSIPSDGSSFTARYWHSAEDGRLQCDLCPRGCRLKDGERGFCFVRAREGNRVVLTTYGRSSGLCIDPIEKKPLNHFLPGTPVLSLGTAGCNLACRFCQNWDVSKSRNLDTIFEQASPESIAAAAVQHQCPTVAFTYNDPVIFLEYAVDAAKACRSHGIRTAAVSAGYILPEPREEFFGWMNAANIDLKSISERFYKKLCAASLGPVLDTLKYLKHETDAWLEITTLLIPGENDSAAEVEQLSRWIADKLGNDVPLHFSAFHGDYKMKKVPKTSAAVLTRAREIAISNGLRYVYTGNVHDQIGGSTLCSGCNRVIIGRDWYEMTEYHINGQGKCNYCDTQCAGVFEGAPGGWGSKRVGVYIEE